MYVHVILPTHLSSPLSFLFLIIYLTFFIIFSLYWRYIVTFTKCFQYISVKFTPSWRKINSPIISYIISNSYKFPVSIQAKVSFELFDSIGVKYTLLSTESSIFLIKYLTPFHSLLPQCHSSAMSIAKSFCFSLSMGQHFCARQWEEKENIFLPCFREIGFLRHHNFLFQK
jgi:hypothetical protein